MNIHTFKDAVTSKRTALVDELEDDDDDDREATVFKRNIEGEEEESNEKFNEAGVPIEPFNMRNEREGGFIDENMNYVFKKEEEEVDAWVSGLDEATLEEAIGQAAMAEKKKAAKQAAEDDKEDDLEFKSESQLKIELLTFMQPGETISSTLKRLSGKPVLKNHIQGEVKRRTAPGKQHAAADLNDQNKKLSAAQQNKIARENKSQIDRVTDLADHLISSGLTGIYSMTYEAIHASTVKWEYKGADDKIYGPFTSQQISEWKSQGFFSGPTSVLMRRVDPLKSHLSNRDNGGIKSVRFEDADKPKPSISIYDNNEVANVADEPLTKRARVESGSISAASENNLVSSSNDLEEWISSDDIDFGEYINLDSNIAGSFAAMREADQFTDDKDQESRSKRAMKYDEASDDEDQYDDN